MKENKMGVKPIPSLILGMSLPVIFSMLVQAMYNVVDSIFVSRVGEEALTAVSLAFPIQLIVIAAFVGLSTGVSSAVSRKLGEKNHEAAVQVAEHGIFIAIILYVIVAIVGLILANFFFQNFTDNVLVIENASIYIRYVTVFSFGIILSHSVTGVLQGTGDMIKPMFAQLIGAIINIILDPILIFGWFGLPAMGVEGAAIATVTAQIISMIFVWIILFKGNSVIKPKIKDFKFDGHIIGQILLVGVPSAIMQGLASVMLTVMNLILSSFGDSAIAVMGVYFRVQSMVLMPIFGLAIGTMPVIGYNFGAKNKERMGKAIKFSVFVAICFMCVCLVTFQVLASDMINIFKPTDEMLKVGVRAFRTISLIFPLVGVTIILSTAFQGLGKAYYSLMISIVRQLVILLPSAFLLSRFGNVDYVWYAFIIAEIIGVTIAVSMFLVTYKKSVHRWEDIN